MIFTQGAPDKIPGFKGGEGALSYDIMQVEEDCRIIHGWIEPGSTIGLHTHEGDYEVIYFLSGQGKMVYDGVEEPVSCGIVHYCPEGHTHTMINTGDEPLVFFAVVPKK